MHTATPDMDICIALNLSVSCQPNFEDIGPLFELYTIVGVP